MWRTIKLSLLGGAGGLLIAGCVFAQQYVLPIYSAKRQVAEHFSGAHIDYHEVLINPSKSILCGIVDVTEPGQRTGQVNFFSLEPGSSINLLASTGFESDVISLKESQ